MTVTYNITFYDAEDKEIGGDRLEWRYTHYGKAIREFWNEICYAEVPKKEFIKIFRTKMDALNIDSDDFSCLVGGLGHIVNLDGWSTATTIHISKS